VALAAAADAAHAQNLNIAFADPLSSLDPQLNNHAGDRSVDLHFWDLLVQNDYNKLVPGLAVSWKNIDPKTWEFKLRPNVKWQDGKPFTAEDVIFSYQRARAVPGSVATFAGYLRTVESVTAKDPLTLVIKTNIPNPDLPLNLASVHIVSKHVGEKSTTENYNSGAAVVGTGPYKFVSYTPGDRVVMQRNDDYWNGKALWEKVNYRYINNGAARTAALLSGDVDVIDKVSVSDLAKLKQSPNVKVYPYNGLRVLLIQPSFHEGPSPFITDNNGKQLDKNPLLDVRVRRAMSLAINRKAVIDRILQGAATEANQWMPADTFGYNPEIKNIPFDATQAKKLLPSRFPGRFQADHPRAQRPLSASTGNHAGVAQFWTRIGIKTRSRCCHGHRIPRVPTRTSSRSRCWPGVTAPAKPATRWSTCWVRSIPRRASAPQLEPLQQPGRGQGPGRFHREFDAAKREAILRGAAKTVSDEVGVIPLYHYQNIWAAKKGLKVTPISSDRTTAMMVTQDKK
jgi:peptide/nickel transport system substrate-binding protein